MGGCTGSRCVGMRVRLQVKVIHPIFPLLHSTQTLPTPFPLRWMEGRRDYVVVLSKRSICNLGIISLCSYSSRMSTKWFCPDHPQTVFEERKRLCTICKSMLHYQCMLSQETGRYDHYSRHCDSCDHCISSNEKEKAKAIKKRKKIEELFAHEKGNLISM
jgi:hypothetical protein